MFQVKNKAVLRLLANRQMKKSLQRNGIAIGAIVLTTVLFTVLFTVAGGIIQQMQQSLMRSNGSTGQAAVDYLSMPEYERLKKAGGYESIAYTIITGTGADSRLERLNTEVRYGEDAAARTVLSYPSSGTMPKETMDIAMPRIVLDTLGLPDTIGTQIPFQIASGNMIYEDTFTLCGVWDGDELAPAQEIWVSKEYSQKIAPAAQNSFSETGIYEGTLCAQIEFSNHWNLAEKLDKLVEKAALPKDSNAGINPVYETSGIAAMDAGTVISGIAMLAVVLISGYLIIYNVFYISVTQDIQFYGLLKTIGASGKQLRRILYRQAGQLSFIGVPIGIFAGYGIGRILLPKIISQLDFTGFGTFTASPAVLIGAALFSIFTVWVSCRRPGRIAAKVSPVEAVHFIEVNNAGKKKNKRTKTTTPYSLALGNVRRDGKKALLVICSLTLSLTLLNGTYTILNGFDLERYVKTQANGDFEVTHWTVGMNGYAEKNLEGMDSSFIEAVQQLSGLERLEKVYGEESYFVNLSDKAKERMSRDAADRGIGYEALEQLNGKEFCSAYAATGTLMEQIDYQDGSFDRAKWESGDYIIYSDEFAEQGQLSNALYQPGDTITLTGQDGLEKKFTVMAIGSLPFSLTSRQYAELSVQVVLPEEAFQALYGEKQPMSLVYDVDDAYLDAAEKRTADLISGSDKTYISHGTLAAEFIQTKRTFTMIGGILSFILAAIGILNFVNVAVTGILTRQKELAMLNAIGMSGRQMKKMLIWESTLYIGSAAVLTLTAGNIMGWLICQTEQIQNQWAFVYHFTVAPILICLPLLLFTAIIIPLLFYRNICRKSIVERLRYE